MEIDFSRWTRILAPRSTVIVTTVNENGTGNTAPFSYVMPVSVFPPLVAIASAHKRHTLLNLRRTGDFVLNLPSREIIDSLWLSSQAYPLGTDEITCSGLTAVPAKKVRPLRIAECFAWLECKVTVEYPAGDHQIVLGEIVVAEINDELIQNDILDLNKIHPLLHLGGKFFSTPGETVTPSLRMK